MLVCQSDKAIHLTIQGKVQHFLQQWVVSLKARQPVTHLVRSIDTSYKDIHKPLQPEDRLTTISNTHMPDREYPHCHTRLSQSGVHVAQDLDSLQASSRKVSL